MTQHDPEFEDFLRRALCEAAESVRPSPDSLPRIRERLFVPYPAPVAWLVVAYGEVIKYTLGWLASAGLRLRELLAAGNERARAALPSALPRWRRLTPGRPAPVLLVSALVLALSMAALAPVARQPPAGNDALGAPTSTGSAGHTGPGAGGSGPNLPPGAQTPNPRETTQDFSQSGCLGQALGLAGSPGSRNANAGGSPDPALCGSGASGPARSPGPVAGARTSPAGSQAPASSPGPAATPASSPGPAASPATATNPASAGSPGAGATSSPPATTSPAPTTTPTPTATATPTPATTATPKPTPTPATTPTPAPTTTPSPPASPTPATRDSTVSTSPATRLTPATSPNRATGPRLRIRAAAGLDLPGRLAARAAAGTLPRASGPDADRAEHYRSGLQRWQRWQRGQRIGWPACIRHPHRWSGCPSDG